MRWLLLGLLLFAFAPSTADAAESPDPVEEAPMAPEDWIPVAGIVCYIVIPAIVVVIGVIAYVDWVQRNTFQAAVIAQPIRPPPPRGLVLFRF